MCFRITVSSVRLIDLRLIVTLSSLVALLGGCAQGAEPSSDTDATGATTPPSPPPSSERAPSSAQPSTSDALSFAVFGGGEPHLLSISNEVKRFSAEHPDPPVDMNVTNLYAGAVPYENVQFRYFDQHPDLVLGFVGGSLEADARAGRFADLTDLWTELGLDGAVAPAVADLASVDGHRYWIPLQAQWNPVFYNTAVFADAKVTVPTTWDELLQACVALRGAGIARPLAQAGLGWSPPAARWFSTLDLALNGPDVHVQVASGRVAWTDPRIRQVFAAWAKLFDGCYGAPALQRYSDPIAQLADGEAAMDNLGEWIFESPDLSDDDPIDFTTLAPITPGLSDTRIALVYGLAIPAGAAHPADARDLVRWLVSSDALQRSYDDLHRLIVDTRVDPGYLDRHRRGQQLLASADRLVELWEFLAPSPQAEIGLKLFTEFLADPASLERDLDAAEQARLDAFGPADS
jgi:multiple sugar transport system substrate-binding protein